MNNTKRIFITQIIILLTLLTIHAQEAQYTYDLSGNRTERNMVQLPPENPGGDNYGGNQEYKYEEQEEEYSDVLNNYEITIFPNPNGGKFDVQISNLEEVLESSITLYTMDGKKVYWQDKPGEVTHVNIRGRENGTYLLKVVLDGEVSVWKIIKQ